MADIEILAIPIPKPDKSGATVCISPRINVSAFVANFADWGDWPDWVNNNLTVRFEFETAGGATSQTPLLTPDITPDSATWFALFGNPNAVPTPQIPVIPYLYTDRTNQSFHSWDGADAADEVKNFYKALAESFPEKPPLGSLVGPGLTGAISSAALEFRSYIATLRQSGAPEKVPAVNPNYGFHEMVYMASGHPYLMRRLGLALDYTFSAPATAAKVRVITNYTGGAKLQIPIAMNVNTSFQPKPNPANSFLPQDDEGWVKATAFSLSNIDHKSGVHQFKVWSDNLQAEEENPLPIPPANGISIQTKGTAIDLEAGLVANFARSQSLEQEIKTLLPGDEIDLYRDDVTIGYRFDVLDESVSPSVWRSLFERQPIPDAVDSSDYRFPTPAFTITGVPDDEGWAGLSMVSEAVETAPPPDPFNADGPDYMPVAPQRYSPDVFFWDGWSGAAPRPGKVIDNAGDVVDPDPTENDPINGIGRILGVNYRPVPGSLPQLRYGHSYRFRCRAVDLTGASIAPTASAPTAAIIGPIIYGRTDPIPAPIPVRRVNKSLPGVGDTVAEIVIKSNYDIDDTTVAHERRVFFPPSSPQRNLERHGRPGDGDDASFYNALATRDALSIDDQTTPDPATDERVVTGNLNRPVVGYLPDPALDAIAFDGLPGAASVVQAPVGGVWPNWTGWSLDLGAGAATPAVDPVPNISVAIELPKAWIRTVQVASVPADNADFHLGTGTNAAVQAALGKGRQWLVSSRTSVRVIHAVRQPLSIPVPDPTNADRTVLPDDGTSPNAPASGLGALTAEIDINVDVDPLGTGRVTCTGTWTDPIDNGPGTPDPGLTNIEGDPGTRTQSGEFGSIPVQYGDADGNVAAENMILDLHDTKAHDVFVTTEAFSRFSSYFTETASIDFPDDAPQVVSASGVAEGSVVIRDSLGDVIGGGNYTVDPLAGTVTPVTGGPLDSAGVVSVDHIPLPVSRLSTEQGAVRPSVVVGASSPPAVPEILEVLPSVARDIREHDGTIRIRHSGQVLRLHLSRPWWTSGRGEALAVITDAVSSTENVTNAGRDPIFSGDGTQARTDTEQWRRSIQTGVFDDLTIAAHGVTYDATKDLWICDIELDADYGYRPFIQPVVARFQPDAMNLAHLSPRVVLDPHRLGVTREVQVRPGQSSVAVTVTGPLNTGVGTNLNEITATLQVKEADIADFELRWMKAPLFSPVVLKRSVRDDGWANWTAKIKYPSPGTEYRLVLEETEPSMRQLSPGNSTLAWDSVYVETVELPV